MGDGNLWEDTETVFNFFTNEKAKLRQVPQVVLGEMISKEAGNLWL